MTDPLRVRARRQKGFDAEFLEPNVGLGGRGSAHDGDHLGGEFEGGALESDASGRDVEAEAKVDVQDVARVVDHDVSVMAVFELEEVRNDGIGGHAFHEIVAGFLKAGGCLGAVFGDEVFVETVDGFTAEHVAGDGIWENVDDAAPRGGGRDAIRIDVDVKTDVVEDAAEGGDDLQDEHVLSAVVADFEDGGLPGFVGIWGGLLTLTASVVVLAGFVG